VESNIRSAFLILKDLKDKNKAPALEVCTVESVANALLDMVVQGLSPLKKQCYFIVYDKTLAIQRSYMGSMRMAKRFGVQSIRDNVIHMGDEFEFDVDIETGDKRVTLHKQTLESLDAPILGAYCILKLAGGDKYCEVMTIADIRKAWGKGRSPLPGKSDPHVDFPGEMAKKSVISRACKLFINTSSDYALEYDEDAADAAQRSVTSANANNGDALSLRRADVALPLEAPALMGDAPSSAAAPAIEGAAGSIEGKGRLLEDDEASASVDETFEYCGAEIDAASYSEPGWF
jgi:recombination protein RecT